MIAVVNFTNGKKNVAIETILHWHISQTSSLYKKEEKKKYTPYLFLKASVFPGRIAIFLRFADEITAKVY